jgi:hypothetical protein
VAHVHRPGRVCRDILDIDHRCPPPHAWSGHSPPALRGDQSAARPAMTAVRQPQVDEARPGQRSRR